jgi:hypothetical protein
VATRDGRVGRSTLPLTGELPALDPSERTAYGVMFWFTWKRLPGS